MLRDQPVLKVLQDQRELKALREVMDWIAGIWMETGFRMLLKIKTMMVFGMHSIAKGPMALLEMLGN